MWTDNSRHATIEWGQIEHHLSGKGAAVFAEGLSGSLASGLGKVRKNKLVGQGVCQRRLTTYKWIADAREYRVTHPKKKLNV